MSMPPPHAERACSSREGVRAIAKGARTVANATKGLAIYKRTGRVNPTTNCSKAFKKRGSGCTNDCVGHGKPPSTSGQDGYRISASQSPSSTRERGRSKNMLWSGWQWRLSTVAAGGKHPLTPLRVSLPLRMGATDNHRTKYGWCLPRQNGGGVGGANLGLLCLQAALRLYCAHASVWRLHAGRRTRGKMSTTAANKITHNSRKIQQKRSS